MKRILLFKSTLILLIICSFAFSGSIFAFEWKDKGLTVKDRDSTEEGTRISLVDSNQKSFVVIYGKDLLTDPVKESIYDIFRQISDTYNLPTSSIEFKIKPKLLQANMVLSETGQIINITNHGLKPSENLIPTVSIMLNEFSTWKDLKIATLQIIAKESGFQTLITPVQQTPLINLKFSSALPQKKIISNLAAFYNDVTGWKEMTLKEFKLSVGKSGFNASIKDQTGKGIQLAYQGAKIQAKQLKSIRRSYNTIAGWKNISRKKILFNVKPGQINAVVPLNKAVYKGRNLVKHIPSGIRLIYKKDLGYNFRAVSGKYFVQINGDYTSENKLLWQINEAVKNPILYIQKYDPEFFFRQLEGIRKQNAEIFNEFRSNFEALQKRYENLKQAHEKFIFGYISMENSGFMRKADSNKQAIRRIIELKSANAALTRGQLEKQLDREKIDVTDKVIDMVLGLYFNDFKK